MPKTRLPCKKRRFWSKKRKEDICGVQKQADLHKEQILHGKAQFMQKMRI
jgi:hypothetical protein